MKTRWNWLVILSLLLGLLFSTGTGSAQTGTSGTVVAWGDNTYGQSTIPYAPGASTIAAGSYHNLVVKKDGTVVAWGNNDYGQSTVPAGLSGVTAIAAGEWHSLALKSDGTVVAWGRNSSGEGSVPTGLSGVTAIAAGSFHNLAVKADGTVVAWGRNSSGEGDVPTGLSGVIAVAAGWQHSLALKSDGTVVAWGWNYYDQSTVPAGLSGVTAIAAGSSHSLALKSDGTVVAWGNNDKGQVSLPYTLSGVIAIAAGKYHNLALTSGGVIIAWGSNDYFQSAVPAGLRGVTAIAGGGLHSLALTSGGAVVAWGGNEYGQGSVTSELTGVIAIAAGDSHSLALKNDGSVVAWGFSDYGVSGVPASVTGVTAIAAGSLHNLVLKADGAVAAWGMNYYGQSSVPDELSGVTVTAIAAGCSHNLALKSDGTVVAWGSNNYGEGTVPAELSGVTVTAIAAGCLHNLALKSDGTVVAWGDNDGGQSTVPAGLNSIIAIAAGGAHSLGLKSDGTVVAWGANTNGQSTVPAGLSGVIAIAAGGAHSLALKTDGTVVAWGDNLKGQTTVPDGLSGVTAIAAGGAHNLGLISDQVATAPEITTQPQSQAVYVGDAASFSAAASGEPTPTVQWQVSTDGGTTWADIAGATASSLTFTASLDQDGSQYHAVFSNSAGSVTSDAATLTVIKKLATVTLANLTQTYDGRPKPVTVTTDPAGLSVGLTYDGSTTAPSYAGSYAVVATINDTTYQGTVSGALTIQGKAASVKPDPTSKVYGDSDPALTGTLSGFVEEDGVTAAYSRAAGEAVGVYAISTVLSPANILANYNITYQNAAFTITPRPVTVTADAKTKVAGELDPPLTYQVTSGSLAFSDGFDGALVRDLGEDVGIYAIRQGMLTLGSNYTLTYIGANLTIVELPAPVMTGISPMAAAAGSPDVTLTVSGSGFVSGSNVRWNGTDLVTTFVSSEELLAVIPAASLVSPQTAQITVFSAGKTSNVLPFFVTEKATSIEYQDTESGTDPIATVNDLEASATGDGLLAVAAYSGNPGGTPSFKSNGAFFDVYAAPGSTFSQVTIKICATTTSDESLFWWDGAQWLKASQQTYDASTGCITLIVTDSSSPNLSQLGGTYFAVGTEISNGLSADPGGPYLGAINIAIQFDGSGSSGAVKYMWDFGDGSTDIETGVMPTHFYTAAGIYDVCLTVNDSDGHSAQACTLAVVYDPSAGFVTGGGWIMSPEGAFKADPSLSGKATFGFVSKYKKGASAPEGNTEFQFQAGAFNFHSTAYEWLVVSKDQATAQFKGSGTVNGGLDSNGNPYKFILWAGDGSSDSGVDTFRIRIWWEDADGVEHDVYDNGFDQAIGGGSIVVHTGK